MEILTEHQLKALDYSNHLSLTANAGTGKTFVLARRYIEIALNENLDLQCIAAITFTEKAASELYKKIAEQVEKRIQDETVKSTLKKLERIRRQLVSANISTIHSFCINILKQFPVEAELDANFVPVDEQISNELIELSVEEVIKNSIKDPDEEKNLKYLIRVFASKNIFARELISLIKNRKNVLETTDKIYHESKNEEEVASFFFSSFKDMCERIFFEDETKIVENIEKINNEVLHSYNQNSTAINASNIIGKLKNAKEFEEKIKLFLELQEQILTKQNSVRSRGYTGKLKNVLAREIEIAENFFNDFSKIPSLENHQQIELELAKFGKLIINFFYKAIDIYSQRKNENSYLDYEDILLFTRKILENENVQSALSDKFKYLMVDEYQDTNEIQYHIFLPILDDLKKGKLFVVGDEKQSIYMFRDAELEVFYKTKDEIEKSAGKKFLLTLPDSFRMSPQVCVFANELFRNLFKNHNYLFNEVEHSDIVCAKQDELFGHVEILLNINNKNDDSEESELIAKRIKIMMNSANSGKQFGWKDFAVLVRKRKSFTELEKTFTLHEIPYLIVGGKGFYQRQSIYDIYNYFSFLLDKNNDAALVGILRSPFFTISDPVIFEISLKAGENFWEKLVSFSHQEKKLEDVIKILNESILLAGNIDLTALLRKILNETPFLSVVAAKPNGKQEIANIEKLIKLTLDFSSQGFFTLFDYVNYLKTSIEQSEDEAQASISEESNAVKIMTLHQAKGLQFDNVFLYGCNGASQRDIVTSKSVTVNKHFGILTKVPVSGDYFGEYKSAPVLGINNIITAKKNSAELKRLFYVGITRAKNYLFLTATTDEQFKVNKNSFLKLLLEGLNIDLTQDIFIQNCNLKFLKIVDDKFKQVEQPVTLNIPIQTEIPDSKVEIREERMLDAQKEFLLAEIKDFPEGEIISATKISIYSQCPVKYQLTYEYGFSSLYDSFKRWNLKQGKFITSSYDFNPKEDKILAIQNEDEKISVGTFADLKGRVIHKILQMEIPIFETEKFIIDEISEENESFELDAKIIDDLKKNIVKDISNYYESKTFSNIKNYKQFKTEFEIYVKEKDYYLYGIIDRLILTGDNAIIIDYKTDDIDEEEIEQKAEIYLLQLKFYAYIVDRFYPGLKQIQLKLIFIKHPDKPVEIEMSVSDFGTVKKLIDEMVGNVRKKEFVKNLAHCEKCKFYFNFEKCIKN